jgi:hypothetical protein
VTGEVWCRVVVVGGDGGRGGAVQILGQGRPDLGTVDLVGRIAAAARAAGLRPVVHALDPRLRELVVLSGLADALLGGSVEVGGKPEQREETLGVEEEVRGGDPAA